LVYEPVKKDIHNNIVFEEKKIYMRKL
jgi:hypothetical protein